LLKQALSIFLKEYITSYKSCDFVISDRKIEIEKPSFVIGNFQGANLPIPFSKSTLIIALEKYYRIQQNSKKEQQPSKIDFDQLQSKISQACKKFEQEIIHIIKEAYE
jgi:hypothetical protein